MGLEGASALLAAFGRAFWQGRSLRHRDGELLGLRSAGIGPDGDEERPLERRRRSCGECERGAAGGLNGALALLTDIGLASWQGRSFRHRNGELLGL